LAEDHFTVNAVAGPEIYKVWAKSQF
jgi:hypothetical protein